MALSFANKKSSVPNVSPGKRAVPGVPEGAERAPPPPPENTAKNSQGNILGQDMRVRIRVPDSYFTVLTSGPDQGLGTSNLGGIIFPYTPNINFDLKADYSPTTPLHSNFSINFYKSSSIGNIAIEGKFTVENYNDADFYISTVHLLKSLTRMRFGLDVNRGSPPPVCRLDAYGQMVLKNVPVAITNFRITLPESVDYYTVYFNDNQVSVPTISSISVNCIPMYSRNEMLNFSVDGYLKGDYLRKGII